MTESRVQFQPTPNPNAVKFVLGRAAVPGGGSRSYFTREQAADDPLAARLFDIPGVASIFMVADFVTVTKSPDADWAEMIPAITAALAGDT